MAITNQPLDLWFNRNSDYGWTGTPFQQTPLGDIANNDFNREGYWTRFLSEQGFGVPGTKGELGRSLWTRANQGYAGALTQNPILKWTDYLKDIDLNHISASMSPQARGEQTQRYTGPLRYQMRQQ